VRADITLWAHKLSRINKTTQQSQAAVPDSLFKSRSTDLRIQQRQTKSHVFQMNCKKRGSHMGQA